MERSGILALLRFCLIILGSPFRERRLRAIAKEAVAWRSCLLEDAECNAEFVAWLTRSADHVRVWFELAEFDEAAARFLESGRGALVAHVVQPTKRWQTAHALLVIGVACLLAGVFPARDLLPVTGEVGTQIGKQHAVTLEDGTILQLNTDSEVQWTFTRDRRVINLVGGEVMVTVGHDARPFALYHGKLLVTDRGTRFAVRAQWPRTEVTVFDGMVSMGAGDPKAGVGRFLTGVSGTEVRQGEIGSVVSGRESDVRVDALDTESLKSRRAWTEGKLVFRNDRLQSIVEEFNRYNFNKLRIAKQCLWDVQTSGVFAATDIQSFAQTLWTMRLHASRQDGIGSDGLVIEGDCPEVRATLAR